MHVHSHSFAVNDTVIGEVAAVKYLGHIIDNNMTYDADMMRQRRQLYTLGSLIKAISYVLHWGEKCIVSLVLYTDAYLPVMVEFLCTKYA